MTHQIYEIITKKITDQLEKGIIPWSKPWTTTTPKNFITKKPYRGFNQVLLHMQEYTSPYYLTYNQCNSIQQHIKKGEHGLPIIYWKPTEYPELDKNNKQILDNNNKPQMKKTLILKYYTVFNTEQTTLKIDTEKLDFNPIDKAEEIINNYQDKPHIEHTRERACYSPNLDTIYMPKKEKFHTTEAYYSTIYHEMIHSTGHQTRLNRTGFNTPEQFGSESYSKEELIAELGACFLCGISQIENKTINNSTAYIQNWLKNLKNDKTLILKSANSAQKATDYILNTYKKEA